MPIFFKKKKTKQFSYLSQNILGQKKKLQKKEVKKQVLSCRKLRQMEG